MRRALGTAAAARVAYNQVAAAGLRGTNGASARPLVIPPLLPTRPVGWSPAWPLAYARAEAAVAAAERAVAAVEVRVKPTLPLPVPVPLTPNP